MPVKAIIVLLIALGIIWIAVCVSRQRPSPRQTILPTLIGYTPIAVLLSAAMLLGSTLDRDDAVARILFGTGCGLEGAGAWLVIGAGAATGWLVCVISVLRRAFEWWRAFVFGSDRSTYYTGGKEAALVGGVIGLAFGLVVHLMVGSYYCGDL